MTVEKRFVPKARKVQDGFVSMVMVRGPKGRLHGSVTSQTVFDTEAQAIANATLAAIRANARLVSLAAI